MRALCSALLQPCLAVLCCAVPSYSPPLNLLPQLQSLSISDTTFTRDPWSLEQLSRLPALSGLCVAWDTGLWAPGQVEAETHALQVGGGGRFGGRVCYM